MDIKELRQTIRMSQRQFAAYFGIPLGTLRNWEQGISNPPSYVFTMIFATIRRDNMINIETIKFVKMLDELAALTANGVEPFSCASSESFGSKVFYDETKPDENGFFPVVLDACIIEDPECLHHDIVSYYDSVSKEYTVRADIVEGEDPSLTVAMLHSDTQIAVYCGRWHFV